MGPTENALSDEWKTVAQLQRLPVGKGFRLWKIRLIRGDAGIQFIKRRTGGQ